MLSIKIPTIYFESNIIMENVCIEALKGNITALVGESGCGKTTIINSLIFKNNFATKYDLDDIILTALTEEEKQSIKFNRMSIVNQNCRFIEDLTVEENIFLVKSILGSNIDECIWIDKLDLNNLFSKFPNELSGGEQVRLSLLLAIIKDGDLVILDEPTSSLDEYYTDIIIEILQELKNNNKIVIVSTHDSKLFQKSDRVYHIQNKRVVLEKSKSNNEDNIAFNCIKKEIIDCNQITNILNGIKKHDRIYKKIILFITIILISFSGFITNFNNAVQIDNQNIINQTSSRELLIYKPSGGYESQGISSSSDGNDIISEDDLSKLKNIKNIEAIKPRVDISMSNPFVLMVEDRDPQMITENYNIRINLNDGNSISKQIDNVEAPTLNTYFKDKDYNKEIFRDFNVEDKGIFISKGLAEFLSEDVSVLQNATITFNMYVPIYNSVGKAWSTNENDDKYWPNLTSCKIVEKTLPISGILKSSNMGIKNTTNYAIYVSDDTMQEVLKEYVVKDSRICYLIDSENYEYSVNKKPENKEILREIKEEPWTAKSYSVFVNDVTGINQVVEEIAKLGFNVTNEYFEISAINDSLESVQNTIKITSYSMTFVVLLIYVVIKFNNKNNESKLISFLYDIGLTKKKIHDINKIRYRNNTIRVCVFSIAVMILLLLAFNFLRYGYTSFGISMFVVVISLSIVIEYLIPIIIERKMIND